MKGFNHFYVETYVRKDTPLLMTAQDSLPGSSYEFIPLDVIGRYLMVPKKEHKEYVGIKDIEVLEEARITQKPEDYKEHTTTGVVLDKDASYGVAIYDKEKHGYRSCPTTITGRQAMQCLMEDSLIRMGQPVANAGVDKGSSAEEYCANLRKIFWDQMNYEAHPDIFKREYLPVSKVVDDQSAVMDDLDENGNLRGKFNIKCSHVVTAPNGQKYVLPLKGIGYQTDGARGDWWTQCIPTLRKEIGEDGKVINRFMQYPEKNEFIRVMNDRFDKRKAAERSKDLSAAFDFDNDEPSKNDKSAEI